jgi:hypothetical protein
VLQQADPFATNYLPETGWKGGVTIVDADLLNTLSAYKLASTSPLINAGIDLEGRFGINPGSNDFYGDAIPSNTALDVGAEEEV